jgi:NitT/TauT family transport system substrate-binding protein
MSHKLKLAITLLLALCLAAAAAPAAIASEQKPTKVKVTEAIHGIFFLPLYVAHGKGYFQEQGLDVELITTQAGPLAMQALLAGQVQFCATGHGLVANLYTKGKPTKIVNQMQSRCTFYLLGRPEIGSIADLKGKSVGCTKIGAESYAIARAIVARAGLDPDKDVTLVGVGGMGTTASALVNDRCQAVIGWQPLTNRFLGEKTATVLAALNTKEGSQMHFGSPDYSFTIIEVTEEYLKENSQTVQKFVNALVKAEKWVTSQDLDKLVAVAQPYFEGMDPAILKASIKEDLPAFSPTGIVAKEGHDAVIKVWMDAGLLKEPVAFEAIVDNSFSEKAQGPKP